ncbi:MAG TPA: hypothetical protein VFO70_06910, partial [Chitinophagaceae bacterium]|nr:hypothetical protein [Chitinophagaceae bacterium]
MTLKRYLFFAFILLSQATSLHSQDYGNIEFIENKGQWDKKIKFKGDVSAGAFFIRSGGFTILQHHPDDLLAVEKDFHGHSEEVASGKGHKKLVLRSHAWNVDFLGSNPHIEIIPDKPIETYNNYFIGNDPTQWAANCRIYQAITLKNVYPNIDVRYYTHNGTLKYDILVK